MEHNCFVKNVFITRSKKWQPPPSWIKKNCCHFFTVGPISTKFGVNLSSSIQNSTASLKMHIQQDSRWRLLPSWILKFGYNFFTIGPIRTKIGGIVANLVWDILFGKKKRKFTKIQDNGCRHLYFRKTVTSSSHLDRSSPSLCESCKFIIERNCHVKNANSPNFKMATAAISKLEILSFVLPIPTNFVMGILQI